MVDPSSALSLDGRDPWSSGDWGKGGEGGERGTDRIFTPFKSFCSTRSLRRTPTILSLEETVFSVLVPGPRGRHVPPVGARHPYPVESGTGESWCKDKKSNKLQDGVRVTSESERTNQNRELTPFTSVSSQGVDPPDLTLRSDRRPRGGWDEGRPVTSSETWDPPSWWGPGDTDRSEVEESGGPTPNRSPTPNLRRPSARPEGPLRSVPTTRHPTHRTNHPGLLNHRTLPTPRDHGTGPNRRPLLPTKVKGGNSRRGRLGPENRKK